MADSSSNCSIGLAKEEICHKQTYVKKIGLIPFESIESIEKQLIVTRSGIQTPIETICYHHNHLLLEKYEGHQKKCCNPFQRHKDSVENYLKALYISRNFIR